MMSLFNENTLMFKNLLITSINDRHEDVHNRAGRLVTDQSF